MQREAEVPVRYKEQQVNVKFHVLKVKNKPAILGRDRLKHFKLDWDSIFTVQKFQTIYPVETFPQFAIDAKPKFHPPRPIPYALHGKVDSELEQMRRKVIQMTCFRP